MASEKRNSLVPSVKIGFLYKLAPKGNFPAGFLVTGHDPVKIIFVPLSCPFSRASSVAGTGAPHIDQGWWQTGLIRRGRPRGRRED